MGFRELGWGRDGWIWVGDGWGDLLLLFLFLVVDDDIFSEGFLVLVVVWLRRV